MVSSRPAAAAGTAAAAMIGRNRMAVPTPLVSSVWDCPRPGPGTVRVWQLCGTLARQPARGGSGRANLIGFRCLSGPAPGLVLPSALVAAGHDSCGEFAALPAQRHF